MPPNCECGHAWVAHFDWEFQREHECTECEDEAYFEERQPLDVCTGYLAVLQPLPLGGAGSQETDDMPRVRLNGPRLGA